MTENLHGIDLFIELRPVESEMEIIVNFKTVETAIVKIELIPFAMGKYPVTNQQYCRFMEESGYRPQDKHDYSYEVFLNHWGKRRGPPADKGPHPVTFVSYEDASAYPLHMKGR